MLEIVLHIVAKVLVPAFLIGMAGSAVVVAVKFISDIRDFRSKDLPVETPKEGLKTPAQTA